MTEYKLYLGIKPNKEHREDDWVVVLVHPEGQACTWFSATGTPYADPPTPYAREQLPNRELPYRHFKSIRPVGVIDYKDLMTLEKIFEDTVPGPSQFFATRFIFACIKQNLVESPTLDGLVSSSKYSAAEWEHFGQTYCPVDEEFLSKASLMQPI